MGMRFVSIVAIALSTATLAACQVAGRNPDAATPDPVIGFFVYRRIATNNSSLNACNSALTGTVSIVSATSTASDLATPRLGCRLAADDGIPIQRVRLLDVGDLKVSTEDKAASAPLPRDPSQSFEYYMSGLTLLAGHYLISTVSSPSGVTFEAPFKMANPASNFTLSSGNVYANQALATPVIANPADAGGTAHARLDSDLVLTYAPPMGVDYVKLTLISDITKADAKSIVCYGAGADTSLTVPAAFMSKLTPSQNATLVVDFATATLKTDVPKVKEIAIEAAQRHIHGRYVVSPPTSTSSCGQPGYGDFGQLILE